MTAMLIDTVLYPPLGLESEKTTLDVMDKVAEKHYFTRVWPSKGFEGHVNRSIMKLHHVSHRNHTLAHI